MQASLAQITQIKVFADDLETTDKLNLQPYTVVKPYRKGEITFHESDFLPAKLYAIASGVIKVSKITTTGKETILRNLGTGEIFAAPAL
ncbi:cyclic nucleotide-binding domain-containing protein [Trichormus azollae]|uniref:cyclic nucleotide-binding domain-containing protein n=1 Tax=Trichormus azollae TaxID=1164 RepID=UPI00325C56AE